MLAEIAPCITPDQVDRKWLNKINHDNAKLPYLMEGMFLLCLEPHSVTERCEQE
jgi:hypothetical protein